MTRHKKNIDCPECNEKVPFGKVSMGVVVYLRDVFNKHIFLHSLFDSHSYVEAGTIMLGSEEVCEYKCSYLNCDRAYVQFKDGRRW